MRGSRCRYWFPTPCRALGVGAVGTQRSVRQLETDTVETRSRRWPRFQEAFGLLPQLWLMRKMHEATEELHELLGGMWENHDGKGGTINVPLRLVLSKPMQVPRVGLIVWGRCREHVRLALLWPLGSHRTNLLTRHTQHDSRVSHSLAAKSLNFVRRLRASSGCASGAKCTSWVGSRVFEMLKPSLALCALCELRHVQVSTSCSSSLQMHCAWHVLEHWCRVLATSPT